MTNAHQLYLLHAISPLHIGVDDSLGAVDLPTMRERHTGDPLVPGSSVKGVLRSEILPAQIPDDLAQIPTDLADTLRNQLAAFGPESAKAGDYRSGLTITDALLFALPVASLCGTFAWVTCPRVLRRLNRDLAVIDPSSKVPVPSPAANRGMVASSEGENKEPASALLIPKQEENGEGQDRVFLQELILPVDRCSSVRELAQKLAGWIWPGEGQEAKEAQEFFRRHLLVVHDDLFGFLTRLAMEVRSRVPIDRETGTAATTGPWSEEHMPAETLLHGLVMGRQTTYREYANRNSGTPATTKTEREAGQNLEVLQQLTASRPLLRFGGNGTIGLGRAFFIPGPQGGQP